VTYDGCLARVMNLKSIKHYSVARSSSTRQISQPRPGFVDRPGLCTSSNASPVLTIERFCVDLPLRIRRPWTRRWNGKYTLLATDSHIHEYACHVANYGYFEGCEIAREGSSDKSCEVKN
jgi:hypothetical protein